MSKLKNRILYELSELKKELLIIEYVGWWLLRVAMIATYVVFTVNGEALYQRNLILLNTLATFAIPLLRFVSPKRLFTSKISFRVQSFVDVFVLLGSFLGHGFKFLGEVHEYDKFMHVIAGGVCVFIGAELIKAFRGYDRLTPGIKTFCGTGFSFIFIVLWENMEFIADWTIKDSNNQGYLDSLDESYLFVKIFGPGKNYPNMNAIYDTNADMLYAVIGAFVCTGILYAVLSSAEKKREIVQSKAIETVIVGCSD